MMNTSNNAANEENPIPLTSRISNTHARAGALGVHGFLQSAPTSVRAQIRLNAWLEVVAGFGATSCSESQLKATRGAAASRAANRRAMTVCVHVRAHFSLRLTAKGSTGREIEGRAVNS